MTREKMHNELSKAYNEQEAKLNAAEARIRELEAHLATANERAFTNWERAVGESALALTFETLMKEAEAQLAEAQSTADIRESQRDTAELSESVTNARINELKAQLAEAERLLESARQECGEWRHRRSLAVIRAEEAEEREGEALKQVATLKVQLSEEYRDWMAEQCNEECRYGERLYAEAKADAARLTRLWQATEAVINDELLAEIRERAEAPEPAEPDWTDARYAQIRRAKGSMAGLIPTTDEIESSEPPRPPHTHYCQEHADMWECSDAACQSGALRECNPAEPHAEEVGE